MSSVQIQREFKERLSSCRERVELRDENGHLVGFFIPSLRDDAEMWEEARNAFTDEDIARARKETGKGVPLQDILQRLEAQWPSK